MTLDSGVLYTYDSTDTESALKVSSLDDSSSNQRFRRSSIASAFHVSALDHLIESHSGNDDEGTENL